MTEYLGQLLCFMEDHKADGKSCKNYTKAFLSLTYAKQVFSKRGLMSALIDAKTAGAVKVFVRNVLKQGLKSDIQQQGHVPFVMRKNKSAVDFSNLAGARIARLAKRPSWKDCSTFSQITFNFRCQISRTI